MVSRTETKVEIRVKINSHHVDIFAYMLEKMRSTPDGDGTLLDHSMILYGSSIADGNQHTHHDLPLVLAGGAGGRLRGGRHVQFPRETPLNLNPAVAEAVLGASG